MSQYSVQQTLGNDSAVAVSPVNADAFSLPESLLTPACGRALAYVIAVSRLPF
ncbi:TPA: hypothetical protein ACIVVN_004633 [Salmonella enterica subsp. enterica serovar Kottbus]